MPKLSTKVITGRIAEFKLYSSSVGSFVQTVRDDLTEEEGFLVPDGHEVEKSKWLELYSMKDFPDGTTEEFFVLPAIAQPTDGTHIYLVGKVLSSDTVNMAQGHGAAKNFTAADLDANGVLTFDHGIAHINPLLQVIDNNNNMALPTEVVNTVGHSKIKIGREIIGTWQVLAYG